MKVVGLVWFAWQACDAVRGTAVPARSAPRGSTTQSTSRRVFTALAVSGCLQCTTAPQNSAGVNSAPALSATTGASLTSAASVAPSESVSNAAVSNAAVSNAAVSNDGSSGATAPDSPSSPSVGETSGPPPAVATSGDSDAVRTGRETENETLGETSRVLDATSSATPSADGETSGPGDSPSCAATFDGQRPPPLGLSGNTFAHDPTMIAAGGEYFRFWTGAFVPSAKSTDLENWENAPTVYGGNYPAWVADWRAQYPGNTFNFPWAPDVSYFGGKYHLYASFSAFFGRNDSCLTHLTTDDLNAPQWTDHGPVICSGSQDSFNAIDPDVGIDAEGNAWLAFGSFWDGIFAFALDSDGNRVGTETTRLAWAKEIEAPVLFYRCGYYYLFVSWGLCCPGEGRSVDDLTYRVVVGRSQHVLGPYVDRAGVPLLEGGGTLVVAGDHQAFAAAGHSDVLVDGDRTYHVYHAYRQSNGDAELRIAELPFDAEGWPVGGSP